MRVGVKGMGSGLKVWLEDFVLMQVLLKQVLC